MFNLRNATVYAMGAAAVILFVTSYMLSQAHKSWETEAKRTDALVVKGGPNPTVKFSADNVGSVEGAVGTWSSIEYKEGDKLAILYKPEASKVALFPNNSAFDARVPGEQTQDVIIGYFLGFACLVFLSAVVVWRAFKVWRLVNKKS